jgi:L-asparaginase / beta-aspartyl-peptidase
VKTLRPNLPSGPFRALCAAGGVALAAACAPAAPPPAAAPGAGDAMSWGLVIHGGAGNLSREAMTPERDSAAHAGLRAALQAGHAVLERGGSSLDAVVAAVNVLEDDPTFNAGRGSVVTADGQFELDAAIMEGATRNAGAVAGLQHVRNPIDLARAVMDRSPHVMMIGAGAETFAREQGLALVEPDYFWTDARRQQWERMRDAEAARGPGALRVPPGDADDRKFGTVGVVALDRAGNLAAGTSTGGMMMKRWGRVGDVPVIGAGTYADNRSCAVSATGHGEFFIRNTVARSVCALVEYAGMPLAAAADSVVMRQLVAQRGDGGVIAMDRRGNVAMPFNTTAMIRGRITADGRVETAIFRD